MTEAIDFKRYEADEIECIVDNETGELGSGSFGVVRLGRHRKLGNVALKCFPISGGHREKRRLEKKIKQEFEVLQKANHDNILRMFGWSKWSEAMALVTEYMRGGNLRDLLLDDVEISPKLCLRMAAELAKGLSFIHNLTEEKRMTHGDMKPENVLLTDDLHCKIGDFGSARFSSYTGSTTSTRSKQRMEFTLVYAAPERLQHGAARVTKEEDTYSFSLILHMLLTRAMLFESDPESFLAAVCRGDRPETWKIDDLKEKCDHDDRVIVELIEQKMKECWQHLADLRPDMLLVRDSLQTHLLQVNPADIQRSVNATLEEMELPPISWDNERTVRLTEYSVVNRTFRNGLSEVVPNQPAMEERRPPVPDDPPAPVAESSIFNTQPRDLTENMAEMEQTPANDLFESSPEDVEQSETNPKLPLKTPEESVGTPTDETNPKYLFEIGSHQSNQLHSPTQSSRDLVDANAQRHLKNTEDSINPSETSMQSSTTTPKQLFHTEHPSLVSTHVDIKTSVQNTEVSTVSNDTKPKKLLYTDSFVQSGDPEGETVPKQVLSTNQFSLEDDSSVSNLPQTVELSSAETQPKVINVSPLFTSASEETRPKVLETYTISGISSIQNLKRSNSDEMTPKQIFQTETGATRPKELLPRVTTSGIETSHNSDIKTPSAVCITSIKLQHDSNTIPQSVPIQSKVRQQRHSFTAGQTRAKPLVRRQASQQPTQTKGLKQTPVLTSTSDGHEKILHQRPLMQPDFSNTSPKEEYDPSLLRKPKELGFGSTEKGPTLINEINIAAYSPSERHSEPQSESPVPIPIEANDLPLQARKGIDDRQITDDGDSIVSVAENPGVAIDGHDENQIWENQIEVNLKICLLVLRDLEMRIAKGDDVAAHNFCRSLKFDSLTIKNYPQTVKKLISFVTTCISQSMPITALDLICQIMEMILGFAPTDQLVKLEACAKLAMHVHKMGQLEVRKTAMDIMYGIVRVVRKVKESPPRSQGLVEAQCLCFIGQCYYFSRQNDSAKHYYITSMEILNQYLGSNAVNVRQVILHYHIALVYERIGKLREAHGELDVAKAALKSLTEVDDSVKKRMMKNIELRIVNCNNYTPDCFIQQMITRLQSSIHVGRYLEVTVNVRKLLDLLQSEPIRNLKMLTKNLILTAANLTKAGRFRDAIHLLSRTFSLVQVEDNDRNRFENLALLTLQLRQVADMVWLHGKQDLLPQLVRIMNDITALADSSDATRSLMTKCYTYLSVCYFYNGEYGKTIEMSSKAEDTNAVQSAPESRHDFTGWHNYNKGLANFMMQKYEVAILEFVKARSCFDLCHSNGSGDSSWVENCKKWITHLNSLAKAEDKIPV